jgi:spore germination protein
LAILVTVLIIIFFVGGVYFFSRESNFSYLPHWNNALDSENTNINLINYQEKELIVDKSLTYSAWIPSWGSAAGYNSLLEKGDMFSSISPVWYGVNADGSLMYRFPENRNELEKLLEKENIQITPTIGLFNHDTLTEILQNENNLQRHINAIIKEVENNNYDGIDLDYEATKLSDKEKYFEFLAKLSERLHADNKLLIVTVLPKWGDSVNYPSLRETREVQNWSEIAKYADEIRIMTYDYTYSGSPRPGPIAPLSWMEEVIKYGLTQVEADKLVLGIHLYSYEWYLVEGDQQFGKPDALKFEENILNNNQTQQRTARAYTYGLVRKALNENQGDSFEFEGENVFHYQKVNDSTKLLEDRVLVYVLPRGIEQRIELAEKYNIKGVVFWRLGGEGELL